MTSKEKKLILSLFGLVSDSIELNQNLIGNDKSETLEDILKREANLSKQFDTLNDKE